MVYQISLQVCQSIKCFIVKIKCYFSTQSKMISSLCVLCKVWSYGGIIVKCQKYKPKKTDKWTYLLTIRSLTGNFVSK